METYRELFDAYFIEVNNLSELLTKYVNSYRLLIGGAGELNNIALARKKDVKNAIERANQLGEIIDILLDVLESVECAYLDYIRLKADLVAVKTQKKLILTEIDNELLFQNSTRGCIKNKDVEHKKNKCNCDGDRKPNKKNKKEKKALDKENDGFDLDNPKVYMYDEEPLDEFINTDNKDDN